MKLKQVGTLFPNRTQVVASYSPTALCINLSQMTRRHLSGINPQAYDNVSHRKLLHHELRHYVDHISTLWGQNKIMDLILAVNAKLGKDESLFHKIITYKTGEQQLYFNKYYTETYNNVNWSPASTWKFDLSTGKRFDSKGNLNDNNPIIFIKFLTTNDLPINRVPLSVAALLEANAMSEEILVEQQFIETLGRDKRVKQQALFDKDMLQGLIYNTDLAIYNAGIHLISVMLKQNTLPSAFEVASKICTIILNLPAELLPLIPIDQKRMEAWEGRPEALLKNGDVGFLLFNMLHNFVGSGSAGDEFTVASFLESNRLPPKAQIEQNILNSMLETLEAIQGQKFFSDFFYNIVSNGIEVFRRRGLDGSGESIRDLLYSAGITPTILTSDFSTRQSIFLSQVLKESEIKTIDHEQWYHLSAELNDNMEEFFMIRGI
jgi:hypothetical protein